MEGTALYDLVESYMREYRKEIDERVTKFFSDNINKELEKLKKFLNDEQLKLVNRYTNSIVMREEEITIEYEIKLLNIGVKIGMQLQSSFDEDANKDIF